MTRQHPTAGELPARSRPLTVVFAPDSFKGSLTSVEVARALASGWAGLRPADTVLLAPLADGGEGTLAAIEAAGGWEPMEAIVHGPLGEARTARWLRSADGRHGVVEMAQASGLSLVPAAAREPVAATTRGTGELVRAVLDDGVRQLTLGIGGSATTDGGLGCLVALGAGWEPGSASTPATVRLDGLDPRLPELELRIACDVTNPLLGPDGAAAVYGPQKGADPAQVALLDARLARWADALEAAAGRHERDTPGAGAAGGLGFGLLCLRDRVRSLELVPGVELVMAQAGLDAKLALADLVITGEGRIDAQTAFGKTALGVARRAVAAGLPCIAVGGGVEPEGAEALAAVGAVVVSVAERSQSIEEAMAAGTIPLERCGERLARLVELGMSLAARRPG
ncbi:MAG: glycerate kinase, partial [Chloroflexi bacterium]|nr:glycerate kinase [Chloroflexota bacterium]